eukprot:Partr_v1_DN28423_c2_g1_i1_m41107 putative WD repeat and HMG-box DNA binding protein 1
MSVTIGQISAPANSHAPGSTRIAWTQDGRNVITASDDALIRLHPVTSTGSLVDDQSGVDIEGTYPVLSLATYGEYIAAGTDEGEVILYHTSGTILQTPLFRTTLPIRHVAFGRGGRLLAIASDDKGLTVLSIPDGQVHVQLKGHTKSVLVCAFISDNELLVGSCDGAAIVYDVENGGRILYQVDSCFKSDLEPESAVFSIVYSSLFNVVAVPNGSSVKLVDPEKGEISKVLNADQSVEFQLLSWSPNGLYLAATAIGGKIIVFDGESGQKVNETANLPAITSIMWHPTLNFLAMSDDQGTFRLWDGVIPLKMRGPVTSVSLTRPAINLLDDECDVTSESGNLMDSRENSDEVINLADDYEDLDDFIVDEDGKDYRLDERRMQAKNARSKASKYDFVPATLHKYVQPNCGSKKGDRQYLAFNMDGVIETIDNGTYHSVNITFHDITSHRPVSFKDHFGFNLAVLNQRAALFASPSTRDSAGKSITTSTLYYRPFETWVNNSDWTMYMPEDEEIVGIALSSTWVAAATSQNNIRFFSTAGTQLTIIAVPGGPMVSMAAHDNTLMLVFNSSHVAGSRLEFQLIDVSMFKSSSPSTCLPLSPKANLEWAGFTELGMPATVDSEGVLRVCRMYMGNIWSPILDTRPARKNKQDHYWPVAVSDDQFMFIWCKAGAKEPGFPKPVLSEIKIQVPLMNGDTPVGALEQELSLAQMLLTYQETEAEALGETEDYFAEFVGKRAKLDKVLLQLILKACKAEKPQTALDLCTRLHMAKSVELAYRLSNQHHLTQLAERIERVRRAKFGQIAKSEPAPVQPVHHAFVEPVEQQREPLEPRFRYDEPQHDFKTPAKRNTDNLFSSPNAVMPAAIVDKPTKVNPFKKTAATAEGNDGKRSAPSVVAASEPKKRKVTQPKMSQFIVNKPTASNTATEVDEEKENELSASPIADMIVADADETE